MQSAWLVRPEGGRENLTGFLSCSGFIVSAESMMRAIVSTVSTGYSPTEVSPESMTASAPSSTALATSLASARVGAGSSFHAGPVVAGGVVYTGNDDGALYALAGSAEPGTPSSSLHRVVYWEETDWPMWFGDGRDVYLKQTFVEAGYEVVDAEGLAAFMEARVADGAPGVVAFVNHYVPPSVLADTSEAALLRRYLAHGRVVWMSPPPLAWVRDPATGSLRVADVSEVELQSGMEELKRRLAECPLVAVIRGVAPGDRT